MMSRPTRNRGNTIPPTPRSDHESVRPFTHRLQPGIQTPRSDDEATNNTFMVSLNVPNDRETSRAFRSVTVPVDSLNLVADDDTFHQQAIDTISKCITDTFGEFFDVDNDTNEAVHYLVESYYNKTHVDRDHFYCLTSANAHGPTLSFHAAVRQCQRHNDPNTPRVVWVYMPERLVDEVKLVVQSVLEDRPNNDFFTRAGPLLPPQVQGGFTLYNRDTSSDKGNFADTLYKSRDGQWQCSLLHAHLQTMTGATPANAEPARDSTSQQQTVTNCVSTDSTQPPAESSTAQVNNSPDSSNSNNIDAHARDLSPTANWGHTTEESIDLAADTPTMGNTSTTSQLPIDTAQGNPNVPIQDLSSIRAQGSGSSPESDVGSSDPTRTTTNIQNATGIPGATDPPTASRSAVNRTATTVANTTQDDISTMEDDRSQTSRRSLSQLAQSFRSSVRDASRTATRSASRFSSRLRSAMRNRNQQSNSANPPSQVTFDVPVNNDTPPRAATLTNFDPYAASPHHTGDNGPIGNSVRTPSPSTTHVAPGTPLAPVQTTTANMHIPAQTAAPYVAPGSNSFFSPPFSTSVHGNPTPHGLRTATANPGSNPPAPPPGPGPAPVPGNNAPHGNSPPSPHGGPPSPPPFGHFGAHSSSPPHILGIDWREHRIDPATIEDHIVQETHTILPWRFPRPEVASIYNHGVRFKMFICTQQSYVRAIRNARLGTDSFSLKNFLYSFPKLPKSAAKSDIFDFLSNVTRYCMGCSVYAPPPHTMVATHNRGEWFGALPPHCIDNWEYYDNSLYQALTSKGTNLDDSDLTKPLLYETSGYQILWRLAYIADHPRLVETHVDFAVPTQKGTDSLLSYRQNWMYYLHMQYLRGIFLSDRYFVELFIKNLHSAFNNNVKPLLLHFVRHIPVDIPVPHYFQPTNILTYLISSAANVGVTTLHPLITPREFLDSRRASKSSATVREVQTSLPIRAIQSTSQSDVVDLRQITDGSVDDDMLLQICSLAAANPRTCDVCGATDHIVATCPRLRRLLEDPVKARRLLSAIEAGHSTRGGSTQTSTPSSSLSSSRARTPPTSNRTTLIRQLQADDTDDDGTASIGTDDDASVDFQ